MPPTAVARDEHGQRTIVLNIQTEPHWLRRFIYNQERPGDTAELLRQARHWTRWLTRRQYRRKHSEMARLTAMPRYQPTTTTLLGTPFELVDAQSFLMMYREIFEQESYAFRARSARPFIIDGGANVGVSVLYFKHAYPDAEIVAFEPEEPVFRALEANVRCAGLRDVRLEPLALWSSETTLEFVSEGADGGRVVAPGCARGPAGLDARLDRAPTRAVRTARLRPYLERHVDFLKLDVEGAELEVLNDTADLLGNVDHLFVEYHSIASQPQELHTLLTHLADAGFRLQVHQVTPTSPRPFMTRYVRWGMDLQLNLFAMRSVCDTRDHARIAHRYRREE